MILLREANGCASSLAGPGIGGHHQDDVAEVGLASVVVSQRAVIHHLQQQVEDIRVGLLDFIQQDDGVGMLGDFLGQQTALIETDIAWGSTDEAGNCVSFHVLRHVVAQQLDTQHFGQLSCDLCLADAGRSGEEKTTDGLLGLT